MTPTFQSRLRNEVWAIVPSYLETLRESVEHAEALAGIVSNEQSAILSAHGSTAVISIAGATGKRLDRYERYWLEMVDYDDVSDAIAMAVGSEEIDQIVFDFNSPGGSSLGLKELASQVAAIEKPTYAFTETLMASAAYYVASQADAIYASPSSRVGSIGARIMYVEQSGFLDKLGVSVSLFGKGKHKTDYSGFKPLSDDEAERLQAAVDKCHAEFRAAVESKRNVDESVFESMLYDSDDALPLGLIDGHINSLAELLAFIE